jgi:hypothetical protein
LPTLFAAKFIASETIHRRVRSPKNQRFEINAELKPNVKIPDIHPFLSLKDLGYDGLGPEIKAQRDQSRIITGKAA